MARPKTDPNRRLPGAPKPPGFSRQSRLGARAGSGWPVPPTVQPLPSAAAEPAGRPDEPAGGKPPSDEAGESGLDRETPDGEREPKRGAGAGGTL